MNPRDGAEALPMSGRTPADGGLAFEARLRAWRFDGFEFDLLRGELRGRDGLPIVLRPKAELLLRQFLAQPGRLLSRDELIGAVWPAAVVTDDSLVQCVGELRAALGDAGARFIRTLPRRGYRFEAEVVPVDDHPAPALAPTDPAAVVTRQPRRSAMSAADAALTFLRRNRWTSALLVSAAAASGVAALQLLQRPAPFSIDQAVAARSKVAVMSFVVLAGEPQLREAADAMSDGIVVQLSTHQGMRPVGRAATAAFDGASPPLVRIAEALKANYVVTGRVGPAGAPGRMSIAAQITMVENGQVLWAKHFESELSARDAMASDIGHQVFNAMRNESVRAAVARAQQPGHQPDLADLALQGWDDLDRRKSLADVYRARSRFEAALRADPSSVIATNGLAASYANERGDPTARMTPEQIAAFERVTEAAHRLAPDDSTALMLWGNMQNTRGRPDLALPALEKAARLVPSYPNGHVLLAHTLLLLGRTDEVQAHADRAVQRGAGDARRTSSAYSISAEAALMRGEDERARDLARRAIAEFPSTARAHATLAAIEALAGRDGPAAEAMAAYRKLRPTGTLASYDALFASTQPAYLAQRVRLYEGLRKAGMPER
jgi:DNA-binding winged helix-turn-helix (wHTH) protein/TolB-like protein/Tfp pilus assembly protein PilF